MTAHRSQPDNELALAVRYGGSVPRYTSYPTAPHFSANVGAERYGDWLGGLSATDPVSLYFHIPFCREMCWYCGCFTKIVRRYEPVSSYVDSLHDEIDLVAARIGARPTATAIHFGGGSPTILSGADWARLFEHIAGHFPISGNAEIAVEKDPRTTTRDYVGTLAKAGVNRISIGVQEFDETIQRAINRVQPFETTARVVEWIRETGIGNLNLDLMYGLPGQTLRHVERMTAKALTFRPQRIALFGYAHVPWMKTHQKMIDEDTLPDTPERWHQASLAAGMLVDAGYVRIGFDHFALPTDPLCRPVEGSVARNFQGYTSDNAKSLIGLGASAISSLARGYAQNVASLRSYQDAVAAGRLPIARGIELSADDKLRREVIERIMCDLVADIGALCTAHGFDAGALDDALARLRPMQADGLVGIASRRVVVTETGRPLVRAVAAAFDAYLERNAARHSSAV